MKNLSPIVSVVIWQGVCSHLARGGLCLEVKVTKNDTYRVVSGFCRQMVFIEGLLKKEICQGDPEVVLVDRWSL